MEEKPSAQVPTHPTRPFQLLAGRVDSMEGPSAADGRTRTVRTKREPGHSEPGVACGEVNKFFFWRNSVTFQGVLGLGQQESEARSLHGGGTIAVEPQGTGRGLGKGAP